MQHDFDKAIADFGEVMGWTPIMLTPTRPAATPGPEEQSPTWPLLITPAIELNPLSFPAKIYRGGAWEMKQEFEKAIADYTDAIRLDPNNADAHYARARRSDLQTRL